MTRTTLGRAFYAVGGNPHAATYAGIDVGKTQFWAFTISGALAGLTGLPLGVAVRRGIRRPRRRVRA
jgi:ribose/xylose/arabinose/galactoside ABC-type transport system permease subunit